MKPFFDLVVLSDRPIPPGGSDRVFAGHFCERDLAPGAWKDMLDEAFALPQSPCVIVTSRLADEYLWAEALNVGAYDVLAKPFEREEVVRIVSLASRSWHDRHLRGSVPKTPRLHAA